MVWYFRIRTAAMMFDSKSHIEVVSNFSQLYVQHQQKPTKQMVSTIQVLWAACMYAQEVHNILLYGRGHIKLIGTPKQICSSVCKSRCDCFYSTCTSVKFPVAQNSSQTTALFVILSGFIKLNSIFGKDFFSNCQ